MGFSAVFAIIGIHLGLGLVLGWWLAQPRQNGGAAESARADASMAAVAIEDLTRFSAHQEIELSGFHSELVSGDFSRCRNPVGRTETLARSNRCFEEQMQTSATRLTSVAQPATAEFRVQLADQVSRHCGRIDQFCRTLEQSLRGRTADEAASVLIGAVSDLTKSNVELASELRAARSEMEAQAGRPVATPKPVVLDPVTGLPGLASFQEHQAALHARYRTAMDGYALVLYAIDHFPELQAQCGAEGADRVLRRFARRLAQSIRVYDHAARLGDDRFAVLLPRCGLYAAEAAAERLREQAMQSLTRHSAASVGYTVSAGVTVALQGEPASAVLQRAESALRTAKAAGGNRCALGTELTGCAASATA